MKKTEVFENKNDAYDESIYFVLDPDEDIKNIKESNNDILEERNNKSDRKRLIGGPSEETFLTLSHALHDFSDLITCLFTKKVLKFSNWQK